MVLPKYVTPTFKFFSFQMLCTGYIFGWNLAQQSALQKSRLSSLISNILQTPSKWPPFKFEKWIIIL